EGGFYFNVGEPDRVVTNLVLLEVLQSVDAIGHRLDAHALRVNAVRGVKRLHRRLCTLALPSCGLGPFRRRLGNRLLGSRRQASGSTLASEVGATAASRASAGLRSAGGNVALVTGAGAAGGCCC